MDLQIEGETDDKSIILRLEIDGTKQKAIRELVTNRFRDIIDKNIDLKRFCLCLRDLDKIISTLRNIAKEFDIYFSCFPVDIVNYIGLKKYGNDQITKGLSISKKILTDYQVRGVQFAYNMQRSIIADEMGVGKTLQALYLIRKTCTESRLFIVVCPSILCSGWLKKCREIDPSYTVIALNGSKDKNLSNLSGVNGIILSYSNTFRNNVIETLLKLKIRTLILDESHYIKNRKSKRTKAVLKLCRRSRFLLLLSGTPLTKPLDMYTQLHALQPQLFPSFFKYNLIDRCSFVGRYCNPCNESTKHGSVWNMNGNSRVVEFRYILSKFVLRRTKISTLNKLPKKIRYEYRVSNKNKNDSSNFLSYGSGNNKAFMERFRETSRNKLELVQPVLKNLISHYKKLSRSVIIFAHHKIMLEKLKCICVDEPTFVIDGLTNRKTRDTYIEQFQATKNFEIMLLSIQAAATGLTLTKASVVIFTEILFGPDTMLQAEDRCHRLGQITDVDIIYIVLDNSTDDHNWKLIKNKFKTISILLSDNEIHNLGKMTLERDITPHNSSLSLINFHKKRKII